MFINKDILSSVQSFTENRLFIYGDSYMKNSLAYEIRVLLVGPLLERNFYISYLVTY